MYEDYVGNSEWMALGHEDYVVMLPSSQNLSTWLLFTIKKCTFPFSELKYSCVHLVKPNCTSVQSDKDKVVKTCMGEFGESCNILPLCRSVEVGMSMRVTRENDLAIERQCERQNQKQSQKNQSWKQFHRPIQLQ